jgi:hypothetical protein
MPPISLTIAFPSLLPPDGSGNARTVHLRHCKHAAHKAPNVSLSACMGAPLLAKTRLKALAHKKIPS